MISLTKYATFVILTLSLFFNFTEPTRAANYYVSNNGLDNNSGTITAPWKTLVFAAGKLVAGDTLFIRSGIYHEKVNFSRSGTASQPITILSYPSEVATIDGNYDIPTSSFSALINFSGSYINSSGIEVKNSLWQGVEVLGSNVTLTNFTSHDNYEQGIITYGSVDAVVQDSVIYNNVKSFENGVHKLGRTSYATGLSAAGASNRSILRRNKIYNNWGEGLSTFNATNTVMEDNVVYDNSKNVYVSDTTGTLLQRNLIYCTPGNIYRLSNTVTQHGINVQDEDQQPASANNTIINNLVMGCVTNFKWYPCSPVSSCTTADSSMNNVLVANNTFVNSTGSTSDPNFYIAAPTNINHVNTRIINNIIEQDDAKTIGAISSPTQGVTFSNNLWSKAPPTTMSGANSLTANPLLSKNGSLTPGDLTADYFKLLTTSPAIDQGATLTEVVKDYFATNRPEGASYDIGAHEFVSTTILVGDINSDGIVNILDYTLLANAFGTTDTKADLNSDGIVNILDYTILSNNFGKTL